MCAVLIELITEEDILFPIIQLYIKTFIFK